MVRTETGILHYMKNAIVKVSTAVAPTLKWFEFRQNNSGGSFVYNENVGREVYIQARTAGEANEIAESIGIYFDGVSDGYDCECCGDRWYSQWDNTDGKDEFPRCWMWDGEADYAELDTVPNRKTGYVVFHYFDGTRTYGVPQLEANQRDSRVI